MTAFVNILKSDLKSGAALAGFVVFSFGFALGAPFGSHILSSFQDRLIFWAPLVFFGLLVASVYRGLIMGCCGVTSHRRAAVYLAALISATLAPPIHLIMQRNFAEAAQSLPSLLEITLLLVTIVFALFAVQGSAPMLKGKRDTAASAKVTQTVAPAPEQLARLAERLDPDVRGKVLHISGRDHYVDVQTAKGEAVLLMRFADAMAEVCPRDGDQIHRSHWVSWSAVESVERKGTKTNLILSCGKRIPVSKNHLPKLAARNFI